MWLYGDFFCIDSQLFVFFHPKKKRAKTMQIYTKPSLFIQIASGLPCVTRDNAGTKKLAANEK